jgi:protein-disulfide isomerase
VRRPRVWIAAAIVAALAVVGVLVGLSVGGGGSSSTAGGDVTAAAREATELFAGVPQRNATLGRSSAPVTLTEYADLQCPACRDAALQRLPHLLERWVRPGKVRLVIRPLVFIGPDSELGAVATVAAGGQDKAWTLADTLYRVQGQENSGWLDHSVVSHAARALGLNAAAFARSTASQATRSAVRANQSAFMAIGANATPTFVARGPGGLKGVEGVPTNAGLDDLVQRALGPT